MRALGTFVLVGMFTLLVGDRLARSQSGHEEIVKPTDVKWGEAPPVFKKGAKMAVLYGDPKGKGLFIVRLKLPAGYKIMPHWHPTDENVTVISGSFAMGMGDTLDAATKATPAGSFMSMPAKMHHFAIAHGETVVDVAAMGPFVMTYVNPADDPSKQQATAK
jgi:quercetin dioxygenase-like cupin family protein